MMATTLSGCSRDVHALEPSQIESQYGVSGAYSGSVPTPGGPMQGTIVPITLAGGRTAQLVVLPRQSGAVASVYLVDDDGIHPVALGENSSRQDIQGAPSIVQRRPAATQSNRRTWEKEVLIIGGSAGAGTAIGAVAGGKKGAVVGAATGGVGGLIYDLLTRDKK